MEDSGLSKGMNGAENSMKNLLRANEFAANEKKLFYTTGLW